MNRAFVAALSLSAGLTAVSAMAQPYQPAYPNGGYPPPSAQYGQPQNGQPPYGQPQYAPAPSQYDREDDRRDQDRGPPQGDDRRYEDRGGQGGYGDRRVQTTPTYPDQVRGDRRYQEDPRSIDPAPGENRPYVGHPGSFYTVEQRLDRVEQRLAGLAASQRKRAYAEMRSIRAEERTQRAKHGGELRDWDREHLNKRVDALVARYPGLGR